MTRTLYAKRWLLEFLFNSCQAGGGKSGIAFRYILIKVLRNEPAPTVSSRDSAKQTGINLLYTFLLPLRSVVPLLLLYSNLCSRCFREFLLQ